MKNWIEKNYKTLIIAAFLVPIITVAIVSISHVTKWYGISNPVTWSVYLSIGIEIAALSALAAISANMGKKVYFPFAIVTIVQFIGNIYFAYSYIDLNSQAFKDWVGLVSPLVEFMGVDPTDFSGHKRFLAFFAGGMLPLISLSFLHMLVQFTEEDRLKAGENNVGENLINNVEAKDIIGEVSRLRLSDNDLEILEKHLLNPEGPNEKLKEAAQRYSDEVREKHTHIEDFKETPVKPQLTQEERGEILAEMMKNDQELGLYDEPFDNPLVKEETSDWDVTLMDGLEDEEPFFTEEELEEIIQEEPTEDEINENFSTIEPNTENIFQEEFTPGLSDEEVMEMNQDEYQRMLDSDEYLTQAIEEFNQQSIEDEKEIEVEVILETPVENVINVVIDEDVLVPPTQSEPLPTPQEQVISVNFSIPNDTIETPTPENSTLENTDVEKKNS
jgi:hypothetical protein